MDDYTQAISSPEDFNPQSWTPKDLDRMLVSLKQKLPKSEAAKLLLPAKEFPFSRVSLGRLSNSLNLVFRSSKKHEPKLAALRHWALHP